MNLRPYRPQAVDPWSLEVLSLVDPDHAQERPHATGWSVAGLRRTQPTVHARPGHPTDMSPSRTLAKEEG
jgi:hypothetical protein